MKANELRIGNILMFTDFPKKEERVICGADIAYAEKEPDWLDAFWTPIPLTEEWLLRFGFNKDDFSRIYVQFTIKHFKIIQNTVDNSFFIDNVKMIKVNVEYVHQLQNLYLDLTGQELELKEL